ncbi:MAG: HAD family phosphatase [Spirochaetales bacterium]|nr:HAD family phosphatase [Spirochaetales bacterium]MCF7937707.1 HAD family phosphatase [Spirochaetales bacterium]
MPIPETSNTATPSTDRKHPIESVVFDFNGTLFWDTRLHNQAWDRFLEQHHISLTDSEKHRILHGRYNADIMQMLFDRPLSDREIAGFIEEKEGIYRRLCLEQHMELAPGAACFLDFLQDRGSAFTIATASGLGNLNFYFEHLGLERWFDMGKITYDNGTHPGKPDPEIFLAAMELIGAAPRSTIIFEDSENGIRAAERTGAAEVYIVNSNNEDYSRWPHPVITDFDQVDRSFFY